MAARVREQRTYDAPLEQVAAMLADPAFREEVLSRQRVERGSVSVEEGGLRIEQVMSTRGLPPAAAGFVGAEIVLVRVERWQDVARRDVHVTIQGQPAELKGQALLADVSAGTRETVDLDVRVRIPLIGGKVEGLVANLVAHALRIEHETGQAWLRG